MPATRAQKARLGIFVAIGLIVLVGGLVALAGARFTEEREHYTIRYDQAGVSLSGLDVGSPVKYSGITVGRVERIRIAPKDISVVEVEISLVEDTPVARDTQANLGSQGITGLKYIELTRGSKAAGLRKPGEQIPPGTAGFDEIANKAGEIADKVSTALDQVNAFVSPEMQQTVASVLRRTDKLLETVEATLSENREVLKTLGERSAAAMSETERLLAHASSIAQRVDTLVQRGTPRIERSLEAIARLLEDLRKSRDDLDAALASADAMMRTADELMRGLLPLVDRSNLMIAQSRENLVEALAYLRETAENMSDFSRRVREDPSLLLLGDSETGP